MSDDSAAAENLNLKSLFKMLTDYIDDRFNKLTSEIEEQGRQFNSFKNVTESRFDKLDDRFNKLTSEIEEQGRQFNRFKNVTESRFDNFEFLRTRSPAHFATGSHLPYVEKGKQGLANYESDDTIVPLPRYFR